MGIRVDEDASGDVWELADQFCRLAVLPSDITAIGGLTMGADGVSFSVAGIAATRGRMLRAFSVRKEDNELLRLSSALNTLMRRLAAERGKLRETVRSRSATTTANRSPSWLTWRRHCTPSPKVSCAAGPWTRSSS